MKSKGIILGGLLLALSGYASTEVGDDVSCWGEFDAPNGHHKLKYNFYIAREKNPAATPLYRPVKVVDALLYFGNPDPLLLKNGAVTYLDEEARSTDRLKSIAFKDDEGRTETTFDFDYTDQCLAKNDGSGVHWRYHAKAVRSGQQAEGDFKATCISTWAVDLYDPSQFCPD